MQYQTGKRTQTCFRGITGNDPPGKEVSVILSPTPPCQTGWSGQVGVKPEHYSTRIGAETVMNFPQFSYDHLIYKGKNKKHSN